MTLASEVITPDGVKVAVNTLGFEVTARLLIAPPVAPTSKESKPLGTSEKVMVMVAVLVAPNLVLSDVMETTLGAVLSIV